MWMVDSTKYIEWIRGRQNPTTILRPCVLTGQIATCGVVRVEVIRGAIKPSVKDELGRLFDAMIEVPISSMVWRRIADTAWALDRKDNLLPVADLIIAGCARHIGAAVVTLDPHFSQIPGLDVQTDLPKLPPDLTGSAFPFAPA